MCTEDIYTCIYSLMHQRCHLFGFKNDQCKGTLSTACRSVLMHAGREVCGVVEVCVLTIVCGVVEVCVLTIVCGIGEVCCIAHGPCWR